MVEERLTLDEWYLVHKALLNLWKLRTTPNDVKNECTLLGRKIQDIVFDFEARERVKNTNS